MREIKFRAFYKGKMYHVVDMTFPILNPEKPISVWIQDYVLNDGKENLIEHVNSNDCILMEYTGLTDCENVDIYEGDICLIELENSGDQWQVQVVYEKGSFSFVTPSFRIPIDVDSEVIGNIYENPELIK